MRFRTMILASALAALASAAAAQDTSSDFVIDWDATPFEANPGDGASSAVRPQSAPKQPLRFGPNSVQFGGVAGTPGARIKPDGSDVNLGIAVAPAFIDQAQDGTLDFENLDTSLSGAVELKFQENNRVTPSVSVSGPIEDGATQSSGSAFRTMFGMDYKF